MFKFENLNIRPVYWLSVLAIFVLSCTHFFKPVTQNTNTTDATRNVITTKAPNKYFILRQGSNSYALKNITVDNVAMTLNGNLSSVDDSHLLYVNAKGRNYKYKLKKDDEINVLREVHIFSKETSVIDTIKPFSLSLDQIEKIEVIERDKQRTTTSYVLGGIGITLGVITVAAIIVALTKSSCPFVSTYDGVQYMVEGELFGGAVNRKLERLDYLPLNIRPVNGEFQLRISNELKEKQFTNFANLVVIEHNSNTQAGIGSDGNVYQLSNRVSPTSALLNNNWDVLKTITQADGVSCNFNDTLSSSATNEMTLTFPYAGDSKKVKLVLQLKNSYWFDYLYGEFTSNFGSRYNNWQKKQNSQPVGKMIQWINDQQIPLNISINTSTGWKEISKLSTIGPLTNRQVVIPVELNSHSNEPIKVKLSTGFMFWELDYAAMDFTVEEPVTVTMLQPYSAVDEKGNDVLDELTGNDEKYLTQLESGNYATLKYKFDKPINSGKSYSVVLATKGYYEPIRDYSGKPNLAFLKKFKEPGAMAAFSKYKYQSIIRNQSIIALNSQ